MTSFDYPATCKIARIAPWKSQAFHKRKEGGKGVDSVDVARCQVQYTGSPTVILSVTGIYDTFSFLVAKILPGSGVE